MQNFQNKVAVITGGNSGIGYTTAQQLKQAGASVLITGRSADAVKKAATELGVAGLVADQANTAALDGLVAEVKQRYGRVDVLFINAGVAQFSPVEFQSEEGYDHQFDINLRGAYFTLQKFLPLLAQGASVILLSSLNAHTAMANTSVYAATKAGLNSLMRTASVELAPRGIRVNAVSPGPIETPIFGKTGMPAEALQGFATVLQNRIPLKRFGKPEEVAAAVRFLASDEASFITGAELVVDGGMGGLGGELS